MENQKYTSKETSMNKHKVPKLATAIARRCQEIKISGLNILDYGGGKYDTATECLAKFGLKNNIYDPYNRTPEENKEALSVFNYDMVMMSNVLNVIAEPGVRNHVIHDAYDHLRIGGVLAIKVYEGNRSGIMTVSEKRGSCQLNKKTSDYIPEVVHVFGERQVTCENLYGVKIIFAMKGEINHVN